MKTATIKKEVPDVGEVEFTGHFNRDILEEITWHELKYSTKQNAKIADVCDDIDPDEFLPDEKRDDFDPEDFEDEDFLLKNKFIEKHGIRADKNNFY